MSSISQLTAPNFDLPGVDGKQHSLADYADAEILVLIETCNHCPYAQAWEGRIDEITREYGARGVRVVAISSNDAEQFPKDSFEEMATRAKANDLSFDYLYDEDQSIARVLGAERTPEVYVFDRGRRLAYHGLVDDDRDGDNITRHYLREALDALLAGNPPGTPETEPVGCTVKWKP